MPLILNINQFTMEWQTCTTLQTNCNAGNFSTRTFGVVPAPSNSRPHLEESPATPILLKNMLWVMLDENTAL